MAHALLRAASTLVSMSARRRDESRRSTQECVRHEGIFNGAIPRVWRFLPGAAQSETLAFNRGRLVRNVRSTVIGL
jgi:hypothetical protein